MKKIFLLLMVSLFWGCQNKQPYEIAVDQYLADHLKDPASYENVELGTPKIITPMSKALAETTKRMTDGEFPSDSISSKLEAIKDFFISQGTNPYDTLAWEVNHKYRAKNSFGAYELENVTYIFDRSLDRIIDVQRK